MTADEVTTTEGADETRPLPNGEVHFILTLNPATGDFGLKPLESVRLNIWPNSDGGESYCDFHDPESGEYSRLPDGEWGEYAVMVVDTIKAGKASLGGETHHETPLEKELKKFLTTKVK